jgi:DNA-binding transcriptional ArsR family regulator
VESQTTAHSDDTTAARARTAPGATKTAVLAALAGGSAMTAGEVAKATGLGRGSVSTTLSKLAKNGDVTKAARGYQIAGQSTAGSSRAAAAKAEDQQPVA